ncbi:MAG TPA: glycosyl hydrolase family 18 protein, partial [Candidatus Limnocylindrales bacterium]|nr:glycosyl hydrolase family 18 protein [Candidatus Limnocylindrales bacterium]
MIRRSGPILLIVALLVGAIMPAAAAATDPPADGSLVTESGRVLPPPPDDLQQPSVHAQMLADEGSGSFDFAPGGAPTILLDGSGRPKVAPGVTSPTGGTLLQPQSTQGLPNGLRKEVLGFLPYWMLSDSVLDSMNYSLVSTVAYFSVGLGQDGYLTKGSSTGWTGWNSATMTQVIDRAHANGVRVVLTVTMMGWSGSSNMDTFLNSATYRSRAVNQIVDAVGRRSADGVNLDFEPVPSSLRNQYVSFVKQLKAGLADGEVGSYLTVCVMAGAATWATGYDVAGLTAAGAADHLFVMGYDYHWSGSSRAGGVAPINSPYTIDVDGTMNDFLAETSGSKLIWGVPYYGRTWPTTSKQLNSTTRGGSSNAYYYTGALAQAREHGRLWDDVGKVPWYRYQDSSGGWVQGYYDDRQSLGVKYDLVNARGFAGTGMWTLLMDAGADELWRLLADKFVTDSAPPVGGISLLPPTVDGLSLNVSWRVLDYASGVDSYKVQLRRNGGSWTTWLSGTRATSAWYSGVAGSSYEFRVQAVDWKGNAQPWITVPPKPASVTPGAFARVSTATLNVRSGAGTGYAIVDTLSAADRVYVLDGPVSASGYEWYRVQYGFSEWPSADYPRIGWSAVGDSGGPFLAPAAPPTLTTLDPFVISVAGPAAFSPNGDGRKDTATVSYRLRDAASSVRLELVNASGATVRSIDLGARPAGNGSAAWDGRTTSGAVAPEGLYLPRIVATDANGAHVGPASGIDPALLARYGIRVDLTAPVITAADPAAGAQMVPAAEPLVINFSEPMYSVGSASVQVRTADGTLLQAENRLRNGRTRLVITPDRPLPTGATLRVRVSGSGRDAAGNRISPRSWTFVTAPGVAYDPSRRMIVERGSHVAYVVGAAGALSAPKSRWFGSASGADVSQRATMPNLPGRWLYVTNGLFSGRWMRESALDHLRGRTERVGYPSSTRMVFAAGTHTGYRFDSAGKVKATKSYRL